MAPYQEKGDRTPLKLLESYLSISILWNNETIEPDIVKAITQWIKTKPKSKGKSPYPYSTPHGPLKPIKGMEFISVFPEGSRYF